MSDEIKNKLYLIDEKLVQLKKDVKIMADAIGNYEFYFNIFIKFIEDYYCDKNRGK